MRSRLFRMRWAYRRFLCRLVGHRFNGQLCVDCWTPDGQQLRQLGEEIGNAILPAMRRMTEAFNEVGRAFAGAYASAHDQGSADS